MRSFAPLTKDRVYWGGWGCLSCRVGVDTLVKKWNPSPVENRKRFLRRPARGWDAIPTELWNWSYPELGQQIRLLNENGTDASWILLNALRAETERLLFKSLSWCQLAAARDALDWLHRRYSQAFSARTLKTIPTYLWLPNELCIGSEAFVTVKTRKLYSVGAWRHVGSQTATAFSMHVPTDLQGWRRPVQDDMHVLPKHRCYPTNPRFAIPQTMPGVINFFCAMGPYDSLVKPIDPFSEKCI
jgi:hypothetical protein